MAVLLLGLHFFTEYPDCVNDKVDIFRFPYLSLSAGSEASMVIRRWDTTLDANTMTYYADAAALMKQQLIPPIVVVTVPLGPQKRHPVVFNLATLLDAADEVNSCLPAQAAV